MNKSESIINITKALSEFQGEVSKIKKDANNPFFKNKYASLDNIIDEIRPLLAKHSLSLMQIPSGDGETVSIKTLLLHTSGEFLEGDDLNMKPVKNDPQGIGSTITYARRYSLSAFLNLNTGEDDDGNKALGKGDKKEVSPKSKQKSEPNTEGFEENPISDTQIKALFALASKKGYNSTSVLEVVAKKYNVPEIAQLSQAQYSAMVKGYEGLENK